MDSLEDTDHPIRRAFHDMPAWQKAAVGATGVMLAPMVLFVGLITALSVWPLFLLGRFEGNVKKGTLERDVERAMRHHRERTDQYYAST